MNKEVIKYTSLEATRALVKFISSVSTIDTKIGEYSKNYGSASNDLICSGHMVDTLGGKGTWLYSLITNTKLNITPKLNNVFDTSPLKLISENFDKLEERFIVDDEELDAETAKQIVSDINKNRKLLMPFKPGNKDFTVTIECENTSVTRAMKLDTIKWSTDKETGDLVCELMCVSKTVMSNRKCNCRVEDYGKGYKVGILKLGIAGNDIKFEDVINMTPAGMIKPFEVVYKTTSIIVDGSYMYLTRNGETTIIGKWEGTNMVEFNHSATNNKAYKKCKKCLEVLQLHKKYIAPYMFVDTKKVIVE